MRVSMFILQQYRGHFIAIEMTLRFLCHMHRRPHLQIAEHNKHAKDKLADLIAEGGWRSGDGDAWLHRLFTLTLPSDPETVIFPDPKTKYEVHGIYMYNLLRV